MKHIVAYYLCDCYIWPCVVYENKARCGRCRGLVDDYGFQTKEEALVEFQKRYKKDPVPIDEPINKW